MIDALVAAVAAILGFLFRDFYTRRRSEQEASRQTTLTFGAPVAIGVSSGAYVTASANEDGALLAREKNSEAAEQFELIDPEDAFAAHLNRPVRFGAQVALRALTQQQYVRAGPERQNNLAADAVEIGNLETFRLLPARGQLWPWSDKSVHYGSAFALQARNRRYVTCDQSDGQRLSATSLQITRQATLVFLKPDPSKDTGG